MANPTARELSRYDVNSYRLDWLLALHEVCEEHGVATSTPVVQLMAIVAAMAGSDIFTPAWGCAGSAGNCAWLGVVDAFLAKNREEISSHRPGPGYQSYRVRMALWMQALPRLKQYQALACLTVACAVWRRESDPARAAAADMQHDPKLSSITPREANAFVLAVGELLVTHASRGDAYLDQLDGELDRLRPPLRRKFVPAPAAFGL